MQEFLNYTVQWAIWGIIVKKVADPDPIRSFLFF